MNDWRTKPRTGKAQIVPWKQIIQTRLDLGSTMRQVYDELVANESVTLGYRQFVRYVHQFTSHVSESVSPSATGRTHADQPSSSKDPVQSVKTRQPKADESQHTKPVTESSKPHPFAHLSERNNPDWKHDGRVHNSVPDRARIYEN